MLCLYLVLKHAPTQKKTALPPQPKITQLSAVNVDFHIVVHAVSLDESQGPSCPFMKLL